MFLLFRVCFMDQKSATVDFSWGVSDHLKRRREASDTGYDALASTAYSFPIVNVVIMCKIDCIHYNLTNPKHLNGSVHITVFTHTHILSNTYTLTQHLTLDHCWRSTSKQCLGYLTTHKRWQMIHQTEWRRVCCVWLRHTGKETAGLIMHVFDSSEEA